MLTERSFRTEVKKLYEMHKQHLLDVGAIREKVFLYAENHTVHVFNAPDEAPLRTFEALFGQQIASQRAIAAIHVGEAWAAPPSPAAELAIRPSEHPDRYEIIFTAGFWPARRVSHVEVARIIRASPLCALDVQDAGQDVKRGQASGWLADLLPQA